MSQAVKPDLIIAPYKPHPWQIAPWRDKSPVLLLTGSAGGGKSRIAAEKVHAFMLKYPGATGLVLRKAREFATKSIVPFMHRKVMGGDDRVAMKKSDSLFEYANGGMLFWGGMKDDSQRESIRSIGQDGSLDIVWIEEGTAFIDADFEEIVARMRGKAAPWTQIIITTNPGPPSHWIYQRLIKDGQGTVFYSSAYDNPSNPAHYYQSLKLLTGVRKLRLVDGKWVQAEGAVYEGYDATIHLKEWFEPPKEWRRLCSIDFGFNNPFVCQWWAIDPDGCMYLYRELYQTQVLVEDHAREIKRLCAGVPKDEWDELTAAQQNERFAAGERIEVFVADHDAEGRATLGNYGISTVAAKKDVQTGIQAVQRRLRAGDDGKPRLILLRGALTDEDEALALKKKPLCTADEIEGYVWEKSREGKEEKEAPVKVDDHGMDATRYMVMHLDQQTVLQETENPFYE